MLSKAKRLCKQALFGRLDRLGNPYYLIPLAIADKLKSDEEKIVALLFKVMENPYYDLLYLKKYGFSNKILLTLDTLKAHKTQSKSEYLACVKTNPIAKSVLIAYMEHTIDSDYEQLTMTRLRMNRLAKMESDINYLIRSDEEIAKARQEIIDMIKPKNKPKSKHYKNNI